MKLFKVFTVVTAIIVSASVQATIITSDASWQQSTDGVNWMPATLQNPTTPDMGVGIPTFFLWNPTTPPVTTFFREQFSLDTTPTYATYHYNFLGVGETKVNGTQIMNFTTTGASQTGGSVVTNLLSPGLNTILVTMPAMANGVPGAFWAWTEIAGANVSTVPEPKTYVLLLSGLGLLGWITRHRKQA